MSNKIRKQPKAIALIAAVFIMLAFGLLGLVGASMLATHVGREWYALKSAQALFVAEAGLQHVIYKLKDDPDYRDNPTTEQNNLAGGSFSVSVIKNGNTYTLTSTGNMAGSSRTIAQTAFVSLWPSVFNDYALFGDSGNMEIKENAIITGSVFQNGDIEIKEDATVSEYAYATGSVTGAGNYTVGTLPDPLPQMPVLDTTYYDSEIVTANGYGGGDQVYDNLDLGGGTVYVGGKATINANGSITGPGTLVAAGEVEIRECSTVGENITIIAGGVLEVKKQSTVGADNVLYASGGIEMQEQGVVIASSSLLTPGNIEIKRNFDFTGIMYAGGELKIKENSTFTAGIVAGSNIEIKENTNIILDVTQFPGSLPAGLESGVSITLSDWKESG